MGERKRERGVPEKPAARLWGWLLGGRGFAGGCGCGLRCPDPSREATRFLGAGGTCLPLTSAVM